MSLLILTNSKDGTADHVVARLRARALPFVRLDTDQDTRFCELEYGRGKVAGPRMILRSGSYTPQDFTAVWFRRPERPTSVLAGDKAESAYIVTEWAAALEGFLAHIPLARWINHPSRNALASHKIEQLTRAQSFGLSVPATFVTQDPVAARAFWTEYRGMVIVKPLSGGYIERDDPAADTVIYTSAVTAEHASQLDGVRLCPTLFQQRVDKRADVRVCVVDATIRAVELRRVGSGGKQLLDIRRDNMVGVEYAITELPAAQRTSILALMRSYELRFGAIDMAVDADGKWTFFEINPNGQWAWLDLEAGTDIASVLIKAAYAI